MYGCVQSASPDDIKEPQPPRDSSFLEIGSFFVILDEATAPFLGRHTSPSSAICQSISFQAGFALQLLTLSEHIVAFA